MLNTKYISRVNTFLLKEALDLTNKHNEIRKEILNRKLVKEDLIGFLGDYGYDELEIEVEILGKRF